MTFTLHLPEGYTPPPLPGRNEWVADLRANPDKQGTGRLSKDGKDCCLGRLCRLQGRLVLERIVFRKIEDMEMWHDGPDGECGMLSIGNPMVEHIGHAGAFPVGVTVRLIDAPHDAGPVGGLTRCNDSGLSFIQIADIIETVWADGGPLPK